MAAPSIPDRLAARLCVHDPRNPCHIPAEPGEEPRAPRRPGCACDLCFYGRDALAVELIAARDALSDALAFVVQMKMLGQSGRVSPASLIPAPFALETKIRDVLEKV